MVFRVKGKRLGLHMGLGLGLLSALVLSARWQSGAISTAYADAPIAPPAPSPIDRGQMSPTGFPDGVVVTPELMLSGASDSVIVTREAELPLDPVPEQTVFLPLVLKPYVVASDPLPPPIPMTGTLPIDFPAIRTELLADGKDLAFVKIGFHVGPTKLDLGQLCDALESLNSHKVPFFIKTVDTMGSCFYEAYEIAESSSVPHTLVYRDTSWDVPDYSKLAADAAQEHWDYHKERLPDQLDESLVWLETMNEVDKERSEWLAEFALETAQLVLAEEGEYRWAAFGWSSGEPEPEDWEGPNMLQFLQLAGDHPDRIAIALHEYSYDVNDIANAYHYLVGRFQTLFQVCDTHNIPRPTVLITEWGWTYNDVPGVSDAMEDIAWASWLYAAYPQVKGAAIWYLGDGDNWGDIGKQTALLIEPMEEYALSHYFVIEQGQGAVAPEIFQP